MHRRSSFNHNNQFSWFTASLIKWTVFSKQSLSCHRQYSTPLSDWPLPTYVCSCVSANSILNVEGKAGWFIISENFGCKHCLFHLILTATAKPKRFPFLHSDFFQFSHDVAPSLSVRLMLWGTLCKFYHRSVHLETLRTLSVAAP